jgi:hypothetical protein
MTTPWSGPPAPGETPWEEEGDPATAWEQHEPEPFAVVREFFADFNTPRHEGDLSLTAFPDALSPSPLTAFSYGPDSIGDVSLGRAARAWRAMVQDGTVLISREESGSWSDPALLFSFSGAHADWLALSFDGSGRAAVALQRPTGVGGDPEIWIYFFDATVSNFVLQNFGPGRSPLAIYDDPLDDTDGDVQIFYADPAGDVFHRQQRNRYAVAYPVPLNVGEDGRLALTARVGGRLSLWGALRHRPTGRWSLERLDSSLFPSRHREWMSLSGRPLGASLLDTPTFFPEEMTLTGAPTGAELRDAVIVLGFTESMALTGSPTGGQLFTTAITHQSAESMTLLGTPLSGILATVVIEHGLTESMLLTGAPTGGQLETV